MAVMTLTGRITKKPEIKKTSRGQLIKIPIRERNKYYTSTNDYPYYNFYTCVAYSKDLIRRAKGLEKYDIVTIICDIIPKRREGVRYVDYIVLDMSVVQLNKYQNGCEPDEEKDEHAKSYGGEVIDEDTDVSDSDNNELSEMDDNENPF